jgi:hypothetical protein
MEQGLVGASRIGVLQSSVWVSLIRQSVKQRRLAGQIVLGLLIAGVKGRETAVIGAPIMVVGVIIQILSQKTAGSILGNRPVV